MSPPALTAYLGQPHLLYIATFAHAASKVGTAAAPRRRTRLDEQGPMFATYLTEAPDGRAVRHLEDTLSRELGLAQAVRGTAKTAALRSPRPWPSPPAHERIVESAARRPESRGISTDQRGMGAASAKPGPAFPAAGGRNGRSTRTTCGKASTDSASNHARAVRRSSGCRPDTSVRYVLDLNSLKGHRIVIGDYASPQAAHQGSLF